MKYVINNCYGGYSLSEAAYRFLGISWDGTGFAFDDERSNPRLVECVEKLGADANGECADLSVIEVPDGISVHLEEYDGMEYIAEDHRTWG